VAAGTGLTQDSSGLSLNLQGVAEAAIRVDDDYIVFLDGGSTGAGKKESIADLATAMAGTGLTASSGELVVLTGTTSGTVAVGTEGFSVHKKSFEITWGTDIGTEVVFAGTPESSGTISTEICTITHNLNTKYVFVSVIEFSSTGEIDGATDFNFVEGAQQQVDMNFMLTAKPLSDNTLLLWSNDGNPTGSSSGVGTGIYTGTVFKVTIIG
jgi:hypothetical protein